jgi:DNA-binding GntR family transcriptional regulator
VGTRVRVPSPDDVRGHYLVRAVLEQEAARLFSETATRAERIDLQRLAARVDAVYMQEAAENRAYYMELHDSFHRRIAECSGCAALCQAIERSRALSSTWLCGAVIEPRLPNIHQDLMNVLVNGTPSEAGAAMRDHVMSSMYRALERLQPYFRTQEKKKDYSRNPRKQFASAYVEREPLSSVSNGASGSV